MSLNGLLNPASIAVVGGGVWCANVIAELEGIGYSGDVWRIHPRDGYKTVSDLPSAPDAAFIGVNSVATVSIVAELAAAGAGGAICFASGFAEAETETAGAMARQAALLDAAGDMPVLGPNCYGVINYLDRVTLWPDQHGGVPVERGIALVTQSSNIAINLTMQMRGLPVAYVVTAGNQAQQGLADIGLALLQDSRVTALGLHVEGVGDVAALDRLSREAEALGKSVVVIKVGASEQAQAATVSHTASLAGSDAGARALFAHLGFAQVQSLDGFLEALKIAHLYGRLESNAVASMSCSGGEASLVADIGAASGLTFPSLQPDQAAKLRKALGPKVALANPLDYHTYTWGDEDALFEAYHAMMTPEHALGILVIDMPRMDRCNPASWEPAFRAVARAQVACGRPMAVMATLPDTLPEDLAIRCVAEGLLPLTGIPAAFEAIAAMSGSKHQSASPLLPRIITSPQLVDEPTSKARLSEFGVPVPRGRLANVDDAAEAASAVGYPVVVKTVGAAHKSETGGVAVNLEDAEQVHRAAALMGGVLFVEEMVGDVVAELLVGVVNDPAHGMVLTLGRGGTETELHADTTHAVLPVTDGRIRAMLEELRMAPLLHGYRGRPAANIDAIVDVVLAVQECVAASPRVTEIEINPLLCRPDSAVAADALIREEPA